MNEDFLQYIWKYKLFDEKSLISNTGEKIKVVNVGEHNRDAGPDFFNAKIKIDQTLWVGNVEVHINSSDWIKHAHHQNKAYDNVILQVVLLNDADIKRTNGGIIPTIELKFDDKLFDNYQKLLKNELWIPCQTDIQKVEKFMIDYWLHNLMIERLEKKSNHILQNLLINKNNWEEAFYQQLAKNFGFKLNAEPFELLAKSIVLNYLAKHKNNLNQLESMFFGQAGMLNKEYPTDEYFQNLKKEYLFLKRKFNLKPIENHLWKFLRLRPSNFPTIRIAQFVKLLYQSSGLFSKIISVENIDELFKLFEVSASEYWDTHYVFNKETAKRKKSLGKLAFYSIVINTIVPFLFVYGKSKGDEVIKKKALLFLEIIPPEKNSIITHWNDLGIRADNAFYTQALLQLKNEYCSFKNCLKCQIGNTIITSY